MLESVGWNVGDRLGSLVGICDGTPLGCRDGRLLGSIDGSLVGLEDGDTVGCKVGSTVRPLGSGWGVGCVYFCGNVERSSEMGEKLRRATNMNG